MNRERPTLKRGALILGYGALGLIASVIVALGGMNLAQPVQEVIFHATYLQLGPSGATKTAIVTQMVGVGFLAAGIASMIGDGVSTRLAHDREIGLMMGTLVVFFLGFLALAFLGLASLPVAGIFFLVAAIGIPVLLWYRLQVRSGAVPAFLGAVPVLLLLLFLTGFGLGWGWGYTVFAEEVSASEVEGEVVNLENSPEIATDLFESGYCSEGGDGLETCYLELRGYDDEKRVIQFLSANGVRCPYENAPYPDAADSFLAQYEGSYYRVTCQPHGD